MAKSPRAPITDLPLIVCPLEFERRALVRALRRASGAGRVEVECSGPGAVAIAAWAEGVGRTERPIVLAGLAGGLVASVRTGTAGSIARVVETDVESWRPPLAGDAFAWSITSTATIVGDPAEKHALAKRTGAHVVDLESVAFARVATRLDWSWGIVRGVSDDAGTAMPREASDWVDAGGRVRPARVIAGVLRRPTVLGAMRRLARDGRQAMDEVAKIVAALCVS